MECSPYRMLFFVLGLFSFGFQIVGLLFPSWERMGIEVHTASLDMSIYLRRGLWLNHVCVNQGYGDTCRLLPASQAWGDSKGNPINDALAQQNFASSFTILKILVLAGGILALVGFLLVLMHFRREDNNVPGRAMAILGTIAWALCGLLVFAAVAIQGFRHANTVSGLEMLESMDAFEGISIELYFPWGILVSGIQMNVPSELFYTSSTGFLRNSWDLTMILFQLILSIF
ncbi:hypothetical protein MAR_009734 [Mya arenaria]|uniref:Claudin n=1 Tax=Mya arenaria TaxID=6604 RepID=A0ABY7E7R1_MYAAR|nr:hypothetical protein MAR_009734 [Mya arenaria]